LAMGIITTNTLQHLFKPYETSLRSKLLQQAIDLPWQSMVFKNVEFFKLFEIKPTTKCISGEEVIMVFLGMGITNHYWCPRKTVFLPKCRVKGWKSRRSKQPTITPWLWWVNLPSQYFAFFLFRGWKSICLGKQWKRSDGDKNWNWSWDLWNSQFSHSCGEWWLQIIKNLGLWYWRRCYRDLAWKQWRFLERKQIGL